MRIAVLGGGFRGVKAVLEDSLVEGPNREGSPK